MDVGRACRPGDEPRVRQVPHVDPELVVGLTRIGRDDLEVSPAPEGNERVSRADAGMASADDRLHAGRFLDPGDPMIEVAHPEQQMIDGGRRGNPAFRIARAAHENPGRPGENAKSKPLTTGRSFPFHGHGVAGWTVTAVP